MPVLFRLHCISQFVKLPAPASDHCYDYRIFYAGGFVFISHKDKYSTGYGLFALQVLGCRAILVIIAVYFIIRGMDRHDVRIQQAATENETQRVWKEFQEKTVSIKLHKKTWKFAHPVQTYLFIGTDKSGNEDAEGEEYHGSMADALMLVVQQIGRASCRERV